jgi:hypothetical protein
MPLGDLHRKFPTGLPNSRAAGRASLAFCSQFAAAMVGDSAALHGHCAGVTCLCTAFCRSAPKSPVCTTHRDGRTAKAVGARWSQRLEDRAQAVSATSVHVGGVGVWVVTSAARRPRRASSFREAKTWLAPSRRRMVYHDIRRAPATDEQRPTALAISTRAKYGDQLNAPPMSRTCRLPPSKTKPLFIG